MQEMAFASPDADFIRDALVSVVIPASGDTPLIELLADAKAVSERDTAYFDERLKVVICLEFPQCDETKLHLYLQKLELTLDVWVVTSNEEAAKSPNPDSAPRELLFTTKIDVTEDPVSVVKQNDENDSFGIMVAWETTITLSRPRLRPPDLFVTFVPAAAIIEQGEIISKEHWLEPFTMPQPSLMPNLQGTLPSEEAQIQSPKTSLPIRVRLKSQASHLMTAYVAIMPRMKYNKLSKSSLTPRMIAALDLEVNPVVDITGTIDDIQLSMNKGEVTTLMPEFLPQAFSSKDCITLLYEIKPPPQSQSSASSGPSINSPLTPSTTTTLMEIRIEITLKLSSSATTTIHMLWTTNVDFSSTLNPAFGPPAQPIQRMNRPSSLNFSAFHEAQNRDRAASVQAASTSLQQQVMSDSPAATDVVSVSFTAPDSKVITGVPFTWHVLIVNNSTRTAKLAIVPLPRIQRPANPSQHFKKRHAPTASNASIITAQAHEHNTSTAKAVVEEQVLYALHHHPPASIGAVPAEVDLVSLTADLRIGPLGIGQCYETDIRFVCYKPGVFNVDAIRVVDLTRESEGNVGAVTDIRELPEIVAEDPIA